LTLTLTTTAFDPTDEILNCKEVLNLVLTEVVAFVIVIFDEFFLEVVTAK
jgi:hypothetical protein